MPKSTEQKLEEAVLVAVQLAEELTAGAAERLTVDFQPSGEYPFRIQIPDEVLPLVGVATAAAPSPDRAERSTGVAGRDGRGA